MQAGAHSFCFVSSLSVWAAPQEFDIGSPGKQDRMEGADDLDEGPITVSERRFRTPVRAPPVKRKKNVQDEEPGTKKIITGEMSDDDHDSNMKTDELT